MAEAAHVGCRDRTREATRGNANRGETHPPAVHADARHYTELSATAPSTVPPLVALRTFLPGPMFADTQGGLMYVAGIGVDSGVTSSLRL